MAFDLGAFAGGFAKGGMDTYTRLSEIEEKQKERALREQEFAWKQREQDQLAAMDRAIQETRGAVGKPMSYVGGEMGPITQEQAQERTAALDLNQAPTLYTQEQADKDMYQRLSGLGVRGVQAATTLRQTALQTKKLEREAEYDSLLDAYTKKLVKMNQIVEQLPNVGLEKVPDLINKDLKEYGLTARYRTIGGAIDGSPSGGVVELLDKKGNVTHTFSDTASVQAAVRGQEDVLHKNVAGQLVTMLPNASDRLKFFQDSQRLAMEQTRVGFEEKRVKLEQDKFNLELENNPLKKQEIEARIKHYNADANYRNAAAKSIGEKTGNWQVLGSDSDGQPISYDRNTGQFARADGKPIQDVSFFKKITGDKPVSDEATKQLQKNYADEVSNAKTPEQIKAVQKKYSALGVNTGYRDVVDEKTKNVKEDIFVKDGKGGSAAPATPASAIPTEAPVPQSKTLYGQTKYTLPGVVGAFDTPEEAQAAWVRAQQPRVGRQY